MPWYLAVANLMKCYMGITLGSEAYSISKAGIYGSIICFIYILFVAFFSLYFQVKARNRFKR